MAFENVRTILSIGSPLSSWKLLLVAASFSRSQYKWLSHALLRPFIHDGEISIRYRCESRYLQTFLRMTDLSSDFQSTMELGARDTYGLDPQFHPDLVIDGGGNIGMFTLRVAAMEVRPGSRRPELILCEPLPRNVAQIERHLEVNQIQAEIMRCCLGGKRRTIPFYCREAINSSFDPAEPYASVIEVPVLLLEDAIGTRPAERILIKLDIEGMEIEVLAAYLPTERRAVYVVGELHEVATNQPLLEKIFRENGWPFEIYGIADNHAMFRACSPAALPMLPSMASPKEPVREMVA